MKFLGLLMVFVCTFGGLVMAAGVEKAMHLLTGIILPSLPAEAVIIMGCAVAAFLIANSPDAVKHTVSYFSALSKPFAYSKEDYMDLLGVMYTIFKLARTKGWLALESHIEEPGESEIINQFESFANNHHAVVFLCDYLRIISLGNEDPNEIGGLLNEEIAVITDHAEHPAHAMQHVADGVPALGIVAAVLGVIKTMASISEPPEVLGKLIGGALVGTFLGVWVAYGMVGPIADAMKEKGQTEIMYYKCIKTGLLAFLRGAAPQVAVEFARKSLPHAVQPTFLEVEDHLNELPTPTA